MDCARLPRPSYSVTVSVFGSPTQLSALQPLESGIPDHHPMLGRFLSSRLVTTRTWLRLQLLGPTLSTLYSLLSIRTPYPDSHPAGISPLHFTSPHRNSLLGVGSPRLDAAYGSRCFASQILLCYMQQSCEEAHAQDWIISDCTQTQGR